MKYLFEVILHFEDGSRNIYNLVDKNDISVRERAIEIEFKSYGQDLSKEDFLKTILFCEIRFNCKLDD
jgi:hypothetical protein